MKNRGNTAGKFYQQLLFLLTQHYIMHFGRKYYEKACGTGLSWMMPALCICGCTLNRKEIITATMWHVYGGQTGSHLNDMIDIFNQTVGKEEGGYAEARMVSGTNSIRKMMNMWSCDRQSAGEVCRIADGQRKEIAKAKAVSKERPLFYGMTGIPSVCGGSPQGA